MYIQITTKCNMSCSHCMFNCTMQGEDMTPEVFAAALELCSGTVSLGGGEPTLHPKFWHFLIDALAHPYAGAEFVWLATNGSQTDTAIKLAELARKGVIGCALSQDDWHDPISKSVVEAFGPPQTRRYSSSIYGASSNDCREIRSVTTISNAGRAKINGINTEDDCGACGYIIKPDGSIRHCNCDDSPIIGDVWKGVSEEYWEENGNDYCYKDLAGYQEEAA